MNYLAINTAINLEILIKYNNEIKYECKDKTLASTHLLPIIFKALNSLNISLNDLDFFACVVGAGSFTGIRIGVTTVNALAYALNKPLVGLTLFDYLVVDKKFPISAVIDATGGICFLQNFHSLIHKDEYLCIKNDSLLNFSFNEIVATSPLNLNENLKPNVEIFKPNKESFMLAVENAYKQNSTSIQLSPLYLRRSQAEREKGEL